MSKRWVGWGGGGGVGLPVLSGRGRGKPTCKWTLEVQTCVELYSSRVNCNNKWGNLYFVVFFTILGRSGSNGISWEGKREEEYVTRVSLSQHRTLAPTGHTLPPHPYLLSSTPWASWLVVSLRQLLCLKQGQLLESGALCLNLGSLHSPLKGCLVLKYPCLDS